MGLFGALLTLMSGGIVVADTCKKASDDRKRREEALREGRTVYTDNNRTQRLASTNEPIYTHGGKIKSLKDGRVIIDRDVAMANKQNDEALSKAEAEGLKYYRRKFPQFSTDNRVLYYTEIDTGRRYYLVHWSENIYKKYYYKTGVSGYTDTDEMVILTKEEYEEWGGYDFFGTQGKYSMFYDGTVVPRYN